MELEKKPTIEELEKRVTELNESLKEEREKRKHLLETISSISNNQSDQFVKLSLNIKKLERYIQDQQDQQDQEKDSRETNTVKLNDTETGKYIAHAVRVIALGVAISFASYGIACIIRSIAWSMGAHGASQVAYEWVTSRRK